MTTSIDHHRARWLYWSHTSQIHLVSTPNLTQDAVNPEVVQGFQLLHANYSTVHQLM